jgi:hypothetical protein
MFEMERVARIAERQIERVVHDQSFIQTWASSSVAKNHTTTTPSPLSAEWLTETTRSVGIREANVAASANTVSQDFMMARKILNRSFMAAHYFNMPN